MKRITPPTMFLAAILYCLTAWFCTAQVSLETLGQLRYSTSTDTHTYGVGVDAGYKLNQWVTGHIRAVSYETDNWRGGAIDEGSLLVEGSLFKSANGKVTASAIGGVYRDFSERSWGLGVGGRLTATLYKKLAAIGEVQVRLHEEAHFELVPVVGLQLSF